MRLLFIEPKTDTLVHANKAKLKFLSLVLLRCKSKFEIFELGLIAVQLIFFSNFRGWPYCGANHFFSNFRGWPYFGANQTFKFLSLALLRCIKNIQNFRVGLIAVQLIFFRIFEVGLIAAQIKLSNF